MQTPNRLIKSVGVVSNNVDQKTVESFGEEWNSFHGFSEKEIKEIGDMYFDIVTPEMFSRESRIIDIGCGSGRFIKYIRERYEHQVIVGIDPSSAILAADSLLGTDEKVILVQAAADNIPYPDNYFDFAYSLGVLHHIPDTQKALNDSVKVLKPGGYFLLYLYYNLDNRNFFFKIIFQLSNLLRGVVSKMPAKAKKIICDILAILLYMPFVLLCRLLKRLGVPESVRKYIPLQGYERQTFYVIRNDSLDRFGTPLEQRFSRKQIKIMMEKAGLHDVVFSEKIPYWHAIGLKT